MMSSSYTGVVKMSYRYTNKLFFKFVQRTTIRGYSDLNCLYKPMLKCKLYNGIKSNIQSYSNITANSKISISLPQYIVNANLPDNLEIENTANLTQQQKSLLLQCCGKTLSNKSIKFRIQLSSKIFENLDSSNSLTIDDCNTYIKISTENEVNINCTNFLKSMKCKPNEETFRLLLENVCEKGDMVQAYDMLSEMKRMEYAVDERVFDALALVRAIAEGLQGVDDVLTTMKAAQINHSSNTNWNILIGLANRNNNSEFMEIFQKSTFTFNEDFFIKLLLKLGLNQNYTLIEEVKRKLVIEEISTHLLHSLEQLCIHLIYRDRAEIAVKIYCTFVEQKIGEGYGRFLLEEMLETDTDPSAMLNVCKYLHNNERNMYALECITEMALRKGKNEIAWVFLEHFDKLRPHYFWPLLLNAGKTSGEKGVLDVLQKMLNLKVEIDSETFQRYVLPFSDLSSPKQFLMRIKYLNFPTKQLLTPMFAQLLKERKLERVHELCDEHDVNLDGSRLIRALSTAWKTTKDKNCTLRVLKRICETNETSADYAGDVLSSMLKLCKTDQDYKHYLEFIEVLLKEKLLITSASNENLLYILEKKGKFDMADQIESALEELMDLSLKQGNTYIPHPKNMTLEELECHLTELRSKNMEIRGVIRRLIQAYNRLGNHARIQELNDLLGEYKYTESPGMVSSVLHTYIKTKRSNEALEKYNELKSKYPSFKIDEYKLIDLAALFVSEDRFEDAMKVLEETCQNRVIRGGPSIEHNCVDLLKEAKTPDQALTLFEFLISNGFCKPKNVILGPVVRSYINCNDLAGAVNYYERCTEQYKCTPLQVELIQVLIKNRDEDLLKRVLDATTKVYGQAKTQMSFAAALAEARMKKPLFKILMEMNHAAKAELKNRCNRWVKEGKLEELLIFAEAWSKFRFHEKELNIVHLAIAELFAIRNDSQGALNFINKMKENDVIVPSQVMDVVNKLMKRNKTLADNEIKCEYSNKV